MRALAATAFGIGMWIILSPQSNGQPEKGVIQSESAAHADKPSESKRNQQAFEKDSMKRANSQAQEQHTQTFNSPEDQKKNEMEIQREIGRYTGWLVLVGAVQFLALIVQAVIYILTLRQMQDTDKRQLRAYVLCESGFIFNVANPVPLFAGQDLPVTDARITNLAAGPGAKIQINNTGQTPEFQDSYWRYI